MRLGLSITTIIVLLTFSIGHSTHADDVTQGTYVLTDLGNFSEGEGADAYGINDSGQVVGDAYPKGANEERTLLRRAFHAFLWQKGTMLDLGTLPGDEISTAVSINSKGQIAGWSGPRGKPFGGRVFLWQSGKMTPLEDLYPGKPSNVYRINNDGDLVGSVAMSTWHQTHAVLWRRGKPMDLGTLPGLDDLSYGAYDMNDKGQIVGAASSATMTLLGLLGGVSRNGYPVLWQDGKISRLETLPGSQETYASLINAAGLIVGVANVPSHQRDEGCNRLVSWRNGKISDAGHFSQFFAVSPLAMNQNGMVVGYATISEIPPVLHAFLWKEGKLTDLDTLIGGPQVKLKAASGINDVGQIVGYGEKKGRRFAYMLTPKKLADGDGISEKGQVKERTGN